MANPLDALTSIFSSSPVIAQSRITRTPIVRGHLDDRSAQFNGPNPLMTIMRGIIGLPPQPGVITIDPQQGGEQPGTVAHESIHALMQPTASDLLRIMGPSRAQQLLGPAAQSAVANIPGGSTGIREGADAGPQEALAYLGADPEDLRGGVPAQRGAALQEIIGRMSQLYPASTASTYRRLITK